MLFDGVGDPKNGRQLSVFEEFDGLSESPEPVLHELLGPLRIKLSKRVVLPGLAVLIPVGGHGPKVGIGRELLDHLGDLTVISVLHLEEGFSLVVLFGLLLHSFELRVHDLDLLRDFAVGGDVLDGAKVLNRLLDLIDSVLELLLFLPHSVLELVLIFFEGFLPLFDEVHDLFRPGVQDPFPTNAVRVVQFLLEVVQYFIDLKVIVDFFLHSVELVRHLLDEVLDFSELLDVVRILPDLLLHQHELVDYLIGLLDGHRLDHLLQVLNEVLVLFDHVVHQLMQVHLEAGNLDAVTDRLFKLLFFLSDLVDLISERENIDTGQVFHQFPTHVMRRDLKDFFVRLELLFELRQRLDGLLKSFFKILIQND